MDIPTETVVKGVPTRLRAESASIPEYLLSRSVAGTSHQDLIDSMSTITDGQVHGRFFAFHPRRKISLLHWLAKWLNKGAVPIATLNLQRGVAWVPGQTIPDAWHHQMIFGVGPNGVYMTNPLENVAEQVLLEQLTSQSELLIRRNDIVSRWHPSSDLQSLAEIDLDKSQCQWDSLNVLGQVVNILREEHQRPPPVQLPSPNQQQQQNYPVQRTQTSHIKIPAVYRAGITLYVAKTNTEVVKELINCPELPIMSSSTS